MVPPLPVTFSIKNVSDDVASTLRARAARNRRSLQRELLTILEDAAAGRPASGAPGPASEALSVEEVFDRAARLLPKGTPSSVELLREMRDLRSGLARQPVASGTRRR